MTAKLLSIAALFSTFLMFSPGAATAQFRLATIDMGRVLNESPAAIKLKSSLDTKTKLVKEKLEAKREELKALEAKAKASGSEDSPENLAFRSEARAYSESVRDNEEEIRGEFLKANKALTDAAVKAVKAFAAKKKYDLVIDSSGRPGGAIVFSENSFDITEAVLKEING